MEGFKIKYSKWLINGMAKPSNVNIGDWYFEISEWQNLVNQ